ncbi:MAG: branched-chain-amino-acid transaminase [Actinobacteria bacterium RBG_13_35_12]|jgi:branched-chain amino acid aminotransferase|nr:MAG: branched-chain-amino-acid transaminase [Actinobacteria bacterium RBG_13_35_12]
MTNPRYAFFEEKIVPIEQAKIDIRTNALQYGTGIFEGIRSYWNEKTKTSFVFRMEDHYKRLMSSSRIMMIEIKYSVKELCDITIELLKKEMYTEDCYIRPFAYNSGLNIGPKLIGNKQDLFIYSIPLGEYLDISKAISVCISSWDRIPDNAIPPRAKISGSYVNAALQKTEALLNGYDEALVLTADGKHVSEGSAMNVFIVKNGNLITPPVTDDILEGITRDTVIKLAVEDENIKVIERSIDRTELYTADELFFCGTGAQISPIGYVDKRPVGNGEMGPVTKKLQKLYFRVVKNEVDKYSNWCRKV